MLLKAVSKAVALTVALGGAATLFAPSGFQTMASNPQAVATTTTIGGPLNYMAGTPNTLTATVGPTATGQSIAPGTVTLTAFKYSAGSYSPTATYTQVDTVSNSDRQADFQTQTFAGNATYRITARYTPNAGTTGSDTSNQTKYLSVYRFDTALALSGAPTPGTAVKATVSSPNRSSDSAVALPSGNVTFTTGNPQCNSNSLGSETRALDGSATSASFAIPSNRKLCQVAYASNDFYNAAPSLSY